MPVFLIALALVAPQVATVASAEEPVIAPVSTSHSAIIAGKSVPYEATFAENVLRDATGRAQATISYTAYVRADVRDRARRPVIFVFNGGPGASSSPLHFSGIGPRLSIRGADGKRSLVDNRTSPIDVADLVFIDPVGTGFSRVLPGGSGLAYWSVPGDAAAVLGVMRGWLRDNHRLQSPVFIAGESYGGARAARIAFDAKDLNVAGIILISPSLKATHEENATSDADFVSALPTMAVAAMQNGKIPRRGVDALFEEARQFAVGDYATALAKGAALDAASRTTIAARMSSLIGLPTDMILAANLRIDGEAFRAALRKPEGLVVGRLDTRVAVAPLGNVPEKRPSAANDPALGLGGSNVIKSELIARYLRSELQVPSSRDYVSLTLDVNFKWNWSASRTDPGSASLAGNIAALMRQKPKMQLLMIVGYYDLAVPLLEPASALSRAGVPADRFETVALEEGHSVFESDAARARLRPKLEAFLLGPAKRAR